jgi:hypothetical protein
VATGFGRTIRRRIFERVEHFSVHQFARFSTASLITRTTNDTTRSDDDGDRGQPPARVPHAAMLLMLNLTSVAITASRTGRTARPCGIRTREAARGHYARLFRSQFEGGS